MRISDWSSDVCSSDLIGIERLDVAERGFPRRRIADVPHRDVAGQRADDVVLVEIARDMAHRAMGVEMRAVEAGDAGGLLPAMLEGMETERHERGRRIGSARNPENAARFAQLVVIERIGGQHCGPGGCW